MDGDDGMMGPGLFSARPLAGAKTGGILQCSMKNTLQGINISRFQGTFEDCFPFPQVGYVNSLEGTTFYSYYLVLLKETPSVKGVVTFSSQLSLALKIKLLGMMQGGPLPVITIYK